MPTPSIARIVHHIEYEGGPCRAACITELNQDGTVGIFLMHPNTGTPIPNVPEHQDVATAGFSWHWPEVVA